MSVAGDRKGAGRAFSLGIGETTRVATDPDLIRIWPIVTEVSSFA